MYNVYNVYTNCNYLYLNLILILSFVLGYKHY